MLDRIDLHVEVPAVRHEELARDNSGETSKAVRERVWRARRIQMRRLQERGSLTNARMSPQHIAGHCGLSGTAEQLLEQAMFRLSLSARAYHRILRVARTIVDLEDSDRIGSHHVAEAIQYRSLDRDL